MLSENMLFLLRNGNCGIQLQLLVLYTVLLFRYTSSKNVGTNVNDSPGFQEKEAKWVSSYHTLDSYFSFSFFPALLFLSHFAAATVVVGCKKRRLPL